MKCRHCELKTWEYTDKIISNHFRQMHTRAVALQSVAFGFW